MTGHGALKRAAGRGGLLQRRNGNPRVLAASRARRSVQVAAGAAGAAGCLQVHDAPVTMMWGPSCTLCRVHIQVPSQRWEYGVQLMVPSTPPAAPISWISRAVPRHTIQM